MAYPKTLAALREQEDRSWTVADALVAEIESAPDGKALDGELGKCSRWLAAQGYEVSTSYLSSMRKTANVFSEKTDLRRWKLSFRLYMAAAKSDWTPQLMDQAASESWTLRQFSEALTGKPWADDDRESVKRLVRTGSLEDKATAAKALLADPDVADEVLSDPVTSQRARDSIERQSRETADALDRGERQERQDRAKHRDLRYLKAENFVQKAKHALMAAVSELRYVEDDEQGLALVREAHAGVKEASALVDARLSSASGTDWDAELARLS